MRLIIGSIYRVLVCLCLVSLLAGCNEKANVTVIQDDGKTVAGQGIQILVDNVPKGVTDVNGVASVAITPNVQHEIRAVIPGVVAGVTQVTAATGQTVPVTVVLGNAGLAESAVTVSAQVVHGIFKAGSTAFSVAMANNKGAQIALTSFGNVLITSVATPDQYADVTELFALDGTGKLVCTNLAEFNSRLSSLPNGQLSLTFDANDKINLVYSGELNFWYGQHDLTIKLLPPASNTSLNVAGVVVHAKFLGDESVSVDVVTNASGSVQLTDLNPGAWEISATISALGLYYEGRASFSLTANVGLDINLKGPQERNGSIPDFVLHPQAVSATDSKLLQPETIALRNERLTHSSVSPRLVLSAATPTEISISTTSGAQDAPVTRTGTLLVPQGTSSITVVYNARSEEYPYFVSIQSIFNDIWNVSVFNADNGQMLWDLTRWVNSQLFGQPVWQMDGSTGEISTQLDVSALTKSHAANLVLSVSATNIGDSYLNTSVVAGLSFTPGLRIKSVTPQGTGDYYSIPASGSHNTYQRYFDVALEKPEDLQNLKFKVSLLRADSRDALMELYDGAVNASIVQDLGQDKYRIQVTLSSLNSSVNGVPPPVHNIAYRFEVSGTSGGEDLSDQKDSSTLHALWKMPDGFARYGARDNGGDDWCSKGGYEWLQNHGDLITRIDDVSGEHGRNIGHATHRQGSDIDIFHYSTLNASSGSNNYLALQQLAQNAINGNQQARNSVAGWIQAQRVGMDSLSNNDDVQFVYSADGVPAGLLPDRWVWTLMTAGSIQSGSHQLDLGLGGWTPSAKIRHNDEHNNHNHIALNTATIANSP